MGVSYAVEYMPRALKSRRALPENRRRQIDGKITAVARDPRGSHPQVKALVGGKGYRLRVGDWRVLFLVDHPTRRVVVVDILKREEAYKRR